MRYLLEAVIQPPSVSFKTGLDEEPIFILEIPNYYVHNIRPIETTIGPRNNSRKISINGKKIAWKRKRERK